MINNVYDNVLSILNSLNKQINDKTLELEKINKSMQTKKNLYQDSFINDTSKSDKYKKAYEDLEDKKRMIQFDIDCLVGAKKNISNNKTFQIKLNKCNDLAQNKIDDITDKIIATNEEIEDIIKNLKSLEQKRLKYFNDIEFIIDESKKANRLLGIICRLKRKIILANCPSYNSITLNKIEEEQNKQSNQRLFNIINARKKINEDYLKSLPQSNKNIIQGKIHS